MYEWDEIDLAGSAHVTFSGKDHGKLAFLAVEADLDVRYGSRDGADCAEFSWEGFDDGTASPFLVKLCESRVDLAFTAGLHDMETPFTRAASCISRIKKEGDVGWAACRRSGIGCRTASWSFRQRGRLVRSIFRRYAELGSVGL